jgi:hypothetical protein
MLGKVLTVGVIGFVLIFVLVPAARRFARTLFTSSKTIVLPASDSVRSTNVGGRAVELVTLLDFDSIPAILEPGFVDASHADGWMEAGEQVLGLSVNGEHRAYPIPMLSRHEIVNDVVGGMPVAVTW